MVVLVVVVFDPLWETMLTQKLGGMSQVGTAVGQYELKLSLVILTR